MLVNNYSKIIIKVLLLLVSIFILNSNIISYIVRFLDRPGGFVLTTLSALIFITIWSLFIVSAILFSFSGWKAKVVSFIVLLLNSVFYIIYNNISSTEMSYFEFMSLMTSISIYKEAIDPIWTFTPTIITVLLWHIPFIVGFFLFPSLKIKKTHMGVAFVLYIVMAMLIAGIIFYKKTGYGSQGMPSFIVPTAFTFSYILDANSRATDLVEARDIPEIEQEGIKNIVLVVDESIRYDYIDLTVNRGTTPSLISNSQYIINLGKSVAYSNCSQYSDGLMRHMARYNKETIDLQQTPFIWDVTKKAGYKNYLFDGQMDGRGHSFFTAEELKDVEVVPLAHFANDIDVSRKLIDLLNDENDDSKKFILVFNTGAHFPYINYGVDHGFKELFKPTLKTRDIRNALQEEVINSYKNLIYYNTNGFFENYFKNMHSLNNTIMIYTSDHGQNLADLSHRMTHCTTIDPRDIEGLVPLLVIGDKQQTQNTVLNNIMSMKRLTSHYDIAPLLMSYMGYSESDIERFMDYKSFDEVGFVYGNVGGYFGGKPERKVIPNQ